MLSDEKVNLYNRELRAALARAQTQSNPFPEKDGREVARLLSQFQRECQDVRDCVMLDPDVAESLSLFLLDAVDATHDVRRF